MIVQLLKSLNETKDTPGIKDVDASGGIVTGYFAAFGNVDSDGDVIQPGAFSKTIAENGPESRLKRIKHCLDHRRDQVVGVLQVLKEDDKGLYYESKIGRSALAQDYLKNCEDKIITEHSIGYRVEKSKYDEVQEVYLLSEIRLYEGSGLQFWGANPETPITGFKADDLKDPKDLETLIVLLEKALQTGTYTDETFRKMQAHFDTLGTILKHRKITEPDASTQPNAKDMAELIARSFSLKLN